MKSRIRRGAPRIGRGLGTIGLAAFLTLSFSGCGLFGDDDAEITGLFDDVCADTQHNYVSQHPNGLGVTSEECAESERGEWLDSRCYCHGQ